MLVVVGAVGAAAAVDAFVCADAVAVWVSGICCLGLGRRSGRAGVGARRRALCRARAGLTQAACRARRPARAARGQGDHGEAEPARPERPARSELAPAVVPRGRASRARNVLSFMRCRRGASSNRRATPGRMFCFRHAGHVCMIGIAGTSGLSTRSQLDFCGERRGTIVAKWDILVCSTHSSIWATASRSGSDT